jgi:hypothetical protein
MGDLAIADGASGSVKPEIGDVMLPAGIEATADFDPQIPYRFVHIEKVRSQTIADFAGESTG